MRLAGRPPTRGRAASFTRLSDGSLTCPVAVDQSSSPSDAKPQILKVARRPDPFPDDLQLGALEDAGLDEAIICQAPQGLDEIGWTEDRLLNFLADVRDTLHIIRDCVQNQIIECRTRHIKAA